MASNDRNSQPEAVKAIKKAWADKTFKAGLLKDANTALAGIGIKVPAGIQVKVIEDTPQVRHYVLPLPPARELKDEHLESVVAGLSLSTRVHSEPGKGG